MKLTAFKTFVVRTLTLLGCIGLGLAASTATADTPNGDEFSEQYSQKLMLQANTKSSIGNELTDKLLAETRLANFATRPWSLSSKDVRAWCESAARTAQIRRGEVDKKGEPLMTVTAYQQSCSDIMVQEFSVKHACKNVTLGSKKNKKPGRQCDLATRMKISKAKAVIKDGALAGFVLDTSFGTKGVHVIEEKTSGSAIIGKKGRAVADSSAIAGTFGGLGRDYRRALLDIREFQLRAPIVFAKDGVAKFCLSKKVVGLDTPFRIVVNTENGEKEIGFAKARKLQDGCTETPATRKLLAAGQPVALGPADSQIILGGDDVSPGMTLWELPTIGLNLDVSTGLMPFVDFDHGPGVSAGIQYNLAGATDVSELHLVIRFNLGFVLDTSTLRDSVAESYEINADSLADSGFVLGGEVGLLKRWYVRRFFVDVGSTFGLSYYLLGTFQTKAGGSVKVGNIALNLTPGLAFGLQLTPRWALRLRTGFKVGFSIPSVTVDDESVDAVNDTSSPMELGVVANLGVLYLF